MLRAGIEPTLLSKIGFEPIVATNYTIGAFNKMSKMVEETSYLAVGKKLGVSDNAVRKHIKKHQAKVAAMGFEPISN